MLDGVGAVAAALRDHGHRLVHHRRVDDAGWTEFTRTFMPARAHSNAADFVISRTAPFDAL